MTDEEIKLLKTKEASELIEIINAQEQELLTIQNELESSKKVRDPKAPYTVKIGKTTYQILAPKFLFQRAHLTATDLQTNSKLAKSILDVPGQNILKPLK